MQLNVESRFIRRKLLLKLNYSPRVAVWKQLSKDNETWPGKKWRTINPWLEKNKQSLETYTQVPSSDLLLLWVLQCNRTDKSLASVKSIVSSVRQVLHPCFTSHLPFLSLGAFIFFVHQTNFVRVLTFNILSNVLRKLHNTSSNASISGAQISHFIWFFLAILVEVMVSAFLKYS